MLCLPLAHINLSACGTDKYPRYKGNGAVFKRLGFLLEKIAPDETEPIDQCRLRLTAGNTKLDPKLNNEKLVTRRRLWVPENWKRLKQVD